MRRYHKNSNGFTMAEMLITVAIIVILCGFGFVAVIAHQRNLKRMEMDETAQEIFIAAQNHLTAARASGQWSSFLEKTAAKGQEGSRGTVMSYKPSDYDKVSDADAESRKFYYFTTESAEAVKNGAEALILPEGSIDETLRGHHFYVEYDAASGTVFGVFYTDSDHPITADDATAVSLSRTDPDARRDYKVDGKRTIIGYYGGALGELNSPGDLYAPSVAVRNAESLVLYVVDKNYYRPVSSKTGAQNFKTKLKLTFEGVTSGEKAVKEVDPSNSSSQTDAFSSAVLAEISAEPFDVVIPSSGASAQQTKAVKAEYYAIVLDSIVRKDGHFADLFPEFIPGEDIRITVTLTSDKAGEDVSQTVTVNSLFNSVKTEKNLSGIASKTVVTVSNPRHLENLSSEVSGVDFAGKQTVKDTTVDTVSVVRNLFWDEDAEAEKGEAANEKVTAFIQAIVSATGMKSEYGYNAGGARDAAAITKENLRVYPYSASGTENAANSSGNSAPTPAAEGENLITKGSCYGITNTAIKTFEGNNHILAAFRFEGKQSAALINEAADGLTVSDLLIADVSSVVTGESADGSGAEETPAAAVLLAKAKSGSIENIAVRWYEGGANQSVTLPAGRNVAAGMQGCRVYAEKGIASALIGSVDAKQSGSTTGSLEISNVSIRTVVKTASAEGKKVTAHLGIEGETTAVLLGEIKSGAVTLDNKQSEEDRKSYVCIEGTLSLKSDKGQEDAQASGGLIGRISGGDNALVKQLDFTASRMEMETEGGAAGGLVGVISGGKKAELEGVSLSANSLDVTGKTAAGGAVGNVSAGELSLNKINILTTKENKQDYGEAGQETNGTEKPYGIRVTAENGTAGGLLGTASSAVTKLTISETAVSGSGTADQVKADSSAGGLIGDTKASNTTITSSAASLYIRSEGNGGNVGGSSSTDGAGGLIGSASGNVTITNSYSGGRTTNASDPDEEKSDASTKQARYVNAEEGQGRYNVYLVSGSGAAGGLLGKFNGTTGSLKIENSYSTSSVAIPYSAGAAGAAAGGLVGDAGTTTLTANNTYCTGRVYAKGAQNGTSVGAASGNAAGSTAGGTSGSTAETSTPNYGTYAGKLGGINGSRNYYLKGMNGIPSDAVGTLNGNTSDITIAENVLAGADYYDDNCALKKGVDTAQKSYYFDTALAAIKYPFKTVTTAIARPVCDPDTGMRKQNAEDDTNKFAQIGDWEIPKEEASAEGAYGLIYYEKIMGDDTLYYHGYMLQSGDDAQNATYKEISSNNTSDPFVHDAGKYVEKDGYLLLVKKNIDVQLKLGIASQNTAISNTGYTLFSLNGAEEKNNFVQNNFGNYKAYTLAAFEDKVEPFCQNQDVTSNFGVAVVLWEERKIDHYNGEYYGWTETKNVPLAAFSYLPFFADTVKGADNGIIQNVSKEGDVNPVSGQTDDANAIIRSANQLSLLSTFENSKDNAYLNGWKKIIIEQQMDIAVDENTFSNGYEYVFNRISGNTSYPEYRSSLRKNAESDHDYYILKGLRKPFIGVLQAAIIRNMQIVDIKARYFSEKLTYNTGLVENIYIEDAIFGKGADQTDLTEGGFASYIQGAKIQNCHITNAVIRGDGFAKTIQHSAEVKNCSIVNAVISGNGFASEINVATVDSCSVYADPETFSTVESDKYYSRNYKPARNGNYGKLVIGIDNSGSRSNQDIAGFVQSVGSGKTKVLNCSVAGMVYGQNVSGFASKIDNGAQVQNCYANVMIDAGVSAAGFTFTVGSNKETKVINCHALGTISALNNAVGGFDFIDNGAQVIKCYEAFWNIKAEKWYPFYRNVGSQVDLRDDYYLRDYTAEVSDSELLDYSDKAEGLSYQQLCDLHIDDLSDQAETTVGYYQYMNKDDDHKIYPYPMPDGMTAYGDWSHEEPDRYTLLYYEKVNGEYYFHGYATEDGENYKAVKTSGGNLENGLLAEKNKTVTEDGYILITGTSGTWSAFGRADNSGNVSSLINNANTNIFQDVSSNADLQKALKALKKKNTDKIYAFQLDKYLAYEDTTKNFASWQTLMKESGGIGISIYSTKGMTPMAKFSFQPFFADTVTQPEIKNESGTSSEKTLSFQTTRYSGSEYDYRIRTLRQLKALSDWDGQRFESIADKENLKKQFDKESTKRFSYLSTSNEQCENHLIIRQDLDIDVNGAEINFNRLDGSYIGRRYGDSSDEPVSLKNIAYDFTDVVAPSGSIRSLVISNANLTGTATTPANGNEIAHGGQREFVEYNYGTISDIVVKDDSTLGSAGLVYQNGDVSENIVNETGRTTDKTYKDWDQRNIYEIKTTIHYTVDEKVEQGKIQNCIIQDSTIKEGAGIVWRNKGGNIQSSKVRNCTQIGHSGFVAYNQSTSVQAPTTVVIYQYWYDGDQSDAKNRVSDEYVKRKEWPTRNESGRVSVNVDSIINNCQVIDCTVTTNGFVGENSVNTQGSAGSTQGSSGVARIQNCQVYGATSYGELVVGGLDGTSGGVSKAAGFAGINGKGAEITDCSVTGNVQGLSEAAGFVRSNAGTISGSYANTNVSVKADTGVSFAGFALTNSGTIEKSHSLGTLTNKGRAGDNQRASGFVIRNADGDNSGAINNSYAAVWSIDVKGTSKNYLPFGSSEGNYTNCYAMKMQQYADYGGSYSGTAPIGVNYVSGENLNKREGKIADLGQAAADDKTTPYLQALKSEKYPFPCSSDIMNYGDWKLTDAAETARTVTLDAGNRAAFSEELALSLSKDAGMMTASDESTDGTTTKTDGESSSMVSIPEEDRQKVQVELGEEEETLDLSQLVPERKGWKLLGWLITAPSELTASTEKTTVSDIVTKATKVSDGSAEEEDADAQNTENAAAGAGDSEETEVPKAIYQLEMGTKSYHFAPDAVITVTEDMTLSAVWVPDDGTIEKAKDGTLRMDENGAILDGEEQVTNDVTNETTETDSDASAADTSSAVTGDDTDGMTSENQDASTDQTADASGTLPTQNTEDDMSEMSDLTGESDPEMETSTETTGEEGDPAGE